MLDLTEQLRVEHVRLPHAHLDHIGALASLADSRYTVASLASPLLWAGTGRAVAVRILPEGRPDMLDVLYIGLVLGFLALSWGLVELCDRL